MTITTASNSTIRSLLSAKPQALNGLAAVSRATLVAPAAPATPPPAAPVSDANRAVTSPVSTTSQISLGTILTLQDARSGDLTKAAVTRALNGYGANSPTRPDAAGAGTDVGKPAASMARLTLAELNSEGANLVNLQTRTMVGAGGSSLANPSPQSLVNLQPV